jgi:hypothetical protein
MGSRAKLGFLILAALSCSGFTCALPPTVNIYRETLHPDAELASTVESWARKNGFSRVNNTPDVEARCPDCTFWTTNDPDLNLSITPRRKNEQPYAQVQMWGLSPRLEWLAQDLEKNLRAMYADIKVERR